MFFSKCDLPEPMEPSTKVLMFRFFGLGRQFGISSNGEIRFIKINIYKCPEDLGPGTNNLYQ
jgi:hypothetical protein